jgi:hypothetical protein
MVEKILFFFFVFSILFTLKVIFEFFVEISKTPPGKFKLNVLKEIGFGLSIAYIITFIFKL